MRSLLFFLVSFFFFCAAMQAQNPKAREIIKQGTNVQKLQKLAQEWEQRDARRYREAVEAARKNNWPIRVEEENRIIEIYALDEQGQPLYRTTYNDDAAVSTQTNELHSGGSSGLNLEGNTMTIGEWDGGATRATHENLNSRVTQVDGATSLSNHATHVAGTLIGDGVPNSAAKGMAPQADLDAYDWNSDDSEMATAAANGLLISNHSYGYIRGWRISGGSWTWGGDFSKSTQEDDDFGQYNIYAQDWDLIANNAPYYLIVKSAGNDRNDGPPPVGTSFTSGGSTYTYDPINNPNTSPPQDGGSNGYDCIGDDGNSKNILTVGAVNDVTNYTGPTSVSMSFFSGWGPTDDGRIKPDICGNGVGLYSSTASSNNSYSSYNGTSMSAPNVAGSLLLLQEYYINTHNNTPMQAATLKALAIHTAREAGNNVGPDYEFGWGLLSTADAAAIITEDTLNADAITELSLSNGSSFSYSFKALGMEPVRATIVWNDPAGSATNVHDDATPVLINDLDLRVSDGSTSHQPYLLNPASPASAATTGDNVVDNVEQVYIASPMAGQTYTLTVNHKGNLSSPQDFSLIISGMQLASCPRPTNLQATNINAHDATLSWTSSAPQFEIRYGLQGFDPNNGGNTLLINTPTATLNNLQSSSDYDIYVRAICAAGDTSFWRELEITTNCSNLEPVVLPYAKGWETSSGTVQADSIINCSMEAQWNFSATQPEGRIRWGADAQAVSQGTGAITLDRASNGSTNINNLTVTLNLSYYSQSKDLQLFFDYIEHTDEVHLNDRVWIRGSSADNWIEIYDLSANPANSYMSVGPIDLDSFLSSNGQSPSSTFQLRFGQEDDFPAPTDGYSFDEISIEHVSTDYIYNGTSWTPENPDGISTGGDRIIVQAGSVSLSNTTVAGDVEVQAGATLTIQSGQTLKVVNPGP